MRDFVRRQIYGLSQRESPPGGLRLALLSFALSPPSPLCFTDVLRC